jgi:hypothetical protein
VVAASAGGAASGVACCSGEVSLVVVDEHAKPVKARQEATTTRGSARVNTREA